MPKGGSRPNSGRPKRNNYKKISITLSTDTLKMVEELKQYDEFISNTIERFLLLGINSEKCSKDTSENILGDPIFVVYKASKTKI